MAFDGVSICALTYELNEKLAGGRVEKALQPEKDEVVLLIRAFGENHRLLISASSFAPRVHLTREVKENPKTAPLFCMLLRKHICGSKIIRFYQPDFERVMVMELSCRDELGDSMVKSLYIEIIGRHSNIILTDSGGRILACIKNVDVSISSVRQVLIGLEYRMPPSQNKKNPLLCSEEEIFKLLNKDMPSDKAIVEGFTGISPLIARELSYRALSDTSVPLRQIDASQKKELARTIFNFFNSLKSKDAFSPVILTDTEKKKPFDFSPVPIEQYGERMDTASCQSISEAVEDFYAERDRQARAKQKAAVLNKFLANNISRCQKKLSVLGQELMQTKNKDDYKLKGDILTANLYKLKDYKNSVTVEDYNTGNMIEIALKPELSPAQNAQRYYNLYNKAKTAEIRLNEQLRICNEELDYLESVQNMLQMCTGDDELNEIKDELILAGYMVGKKKAGRGKKAQNPSEPLHFTTSDGFDVYVGKNNLQNDNLTMKKAKANDLWLHVKNMPGSHTILVSKGKSFTEQAIIEAAQIAARHSKAKNSSNVPVDYTTIKNVKKPAGAKPGFVIYENYKTVFVNP